MDEIKDNIYIGNWQEARDNKGSFTIFSVSVTENPNRGDFQYNMRDGGDTDYEEFKKTIYDLNNYRINNLYKFIAVAAKVEALL